MKYEDYELQYLQMMQENITRMASNSANAKTWLVTIVSAFLAIGCNIKDLDYWLLLAIVPILVLWYIDAYYLNLERALRNREQYFLNIKKKEGSSEKELEIALFTFKPLFKDKNDKQFGYVKNGCMIFNKSVWPVYVALLVCILIITGIVNNWFSNFCHCCCCQ